MKSILENEFSYFPYDVENMRLTPKQNMPVRRKVLKGREDFPRIEQRTLRQAKPVNINDRGELALNLRKRLIPNLTARHQQQFYKTLQENADFIQEVESLKQFYRFCEMDSVKVFLRRNRFLVPLLREVPEKIYGYFGKDQKLDLRISFESDSPQSSELWVSILTELSAAEALPILERFDEEWWLENMDRADCKLNITLKFV
jgi:hypothetical protein